ncbi:MAG TPA: phosphatidylglycerophosphatase A [Thermoanaerobaculia bacterium]|nr:phosphatidylglycerophosphatase A [Thermoanaerobaculia bacterium]
MNDKTGRGGFQGGWSGVFRRVPVSTLLATWFGAGFLPIAPGTWGSLAAIPLAYLLYAALGLYGVAVFVALCSVVGVFVSGRVARNRGIEDPSEVVIDEVAGQTIALLGVFAFCPMSLSSWITWGMTALAFFLFRLFDVWKPGPIGRLERLPGGFGIMADDLLSGLVVCVLVGALCLALYRR